MEFLKRELPFIPFGTDGVRGITDSQLTPEFVLELGKAAAKFFKLDNADTVMIGKDTRASCDMLDAALASGMMQEGLNVVSVGIIPTPGVAHAAKKRGYPAAVISASHNPAEHNGIKFFSAEGFKITEAEEKRIEGFLRDKTDTRTLDYGKYSHDVTARIEYKGFLERTVDCDFEGLKIGIDCSNGATYNIAPDVFTDLGAEVHIIGVNPDGKNINQDCGSTHIEPLSKLVVENNLDFGLAFDGDGDRIIAIDEAGNEVDGDFIIAILAKHLLKNNKLKNKAVVVTVMANFGFDLAMNKLGINVTKCAVGDRHVIKEMLDNDIQIGGEQSGHIILSNFVTTGDGILTALQLASVIKKEEKPLTILASCMKKAPQKLVNIKVNNKTDYFNSKTIKETIEQAQSVLGSNGRVLVRPSGTEPLIRVMVEAQNIDEVLKHSDSISGVICSELNGCIN